MPDGHRIREHAHDWHQLVHAIEGVMTVETAEGLWVVPPHRAVWIPAGHRHAVRMTGRTWMRTLYLRPGIERDLATAPIGAPRVPAGCGAIDVSPLLRELVLEIVRLEMLRWDEPAHRRLALVLLDRIERPRAALLELRRPSDPRARRVADRALASIDAPIVLSELAAGSGASVRTIERLFRAETGSTFGRWLQRAKALHALERLASGDSVTRAGLSVGYDSPSAFIAMFKRVMGTTPGRAVRPPPSRNDGLR